MSQTYIKEWRIYRGLTQRALADRTGMSLAGLSRLERGTQRYNADLLDKIAAALGVYVSDLLTKDPNNPDPLAEALAGLTPAQTAQALAVIKAIKEGPQ